MWRRQRLNASCVIDPMHRASLGRGRLLGSAKGFVMEAIGRKNKIPERET
jgi:hypothetical protein